MAMGFRWLAHEQECDHRHSKTISTGGIRRRVCENCGHVEIQSAAELTGDLDRALFARRSEQQGQTLTGVGSPG